MNAAGEFFREGLKSSGFEGFVSFDSLRASGSADVPDAPGVYVVLLEDGGPPSFLDANPGGRFKQRNPTVDTALLRAKWIEGAHVVYIGKADRLRRRLRQFADFGSGKPIGHWGGRYIWQLAASDDLIVAWQLTPPAQTAREAEVALMERFRAAHGGRLPFANIAN